MMLHMQAFLNLGWGLGNILGECQLSSSLKLPQSLGPHKLHVVLPLRILWNV